MYEEASGVIFLYIPSMYNLYVIHVLACSSIAPLALFSFIYLFASLNDSIYNWYKFIMCAACFLCTYLTRK